MKIFENISGFIPVNMVNYLTSGSIRHMAMDEHSARTPEASALRCLADSQAVGSMTFFHRGTPGFSGVLCCQLGGDADIPLSDSHTWRKVLDFALVHIKRIAMLPVHLVVTPAHFKSNNRPITIYTLSTDNLTSPSVFGRSVLFRALVMHQAVSVSSMLSVASFNATDSILGGGSHE